jgi:DNA polymerase-3 subunit delta
VINYCRDKGLKAPGSTDKSQLLENAVTRGFPENHHLIITTDITDRRRRLYKVIAENGMVIDCSVATGSRQAEKNAQEVVLKERMTAILKKFDKKMDTAAFRALVEKTGFNLRTFCTSLEKLVNYVGDRPRIQVADVKKTLRRTRQDPIFELTSAVAERNSEAGLFFLKSMILGELHPLQIIAAIANQVRKLIVAREFIESAHGRQWRPRIPYDQFRRSVMPAVVAYDDELRAMLAMWDDALIPNTQNIKNEGARPKKKKGKKKKPPASQLVLAPNPNNPYPVLKTLENANRFTSAELTQGLSDIYATDLQLKTGQKNPKVLLDNLIIKICRREQSKE